MKVFDFDNTIYGGESVFDFAMFFVKRKKSFIKYVPNFIKILFSYKMCHMDISEFQKALEKYANPFLENQEYIKELVAEFWLQNIEKLYPNILKKIEKDDVIITASPDFLIDGIKDVLNTDHILCSKLDLEKGKISFLNFRENKVKCFMEKYDEKKIEEFYTDSYNDKPLMDISKHVFLVHHGKLKKLK